MGEEIAEVEAEIKTIVDEIDSLITAIPKTGYTLGAKINAELAAFQDLKAQIKSLLAERAETEIPYISRGLVALR